MNFAMSKAEFTAHKRNAYMAAVADVAGSGVRFSDIELYVQSISDSAIYGGGNPTRRRLLQDDTVHHCSDSFKIAHKLQLHPYNALCFLEVHVSKFALIISDSLQGIRVDTFIKTENSTVASQVGAAVTNPDSWDSAIISSLAEDIPEMDASSGLNITNEPFRLSTTVRDDDWTYIPGHAREKLSYCPCTTKVLAMAAAQAAAEGGEPRPECYCSGGGYAVP